MTAARKIALGSSLALGAVLLAGAAAISILLAIPFQRSAEPAAVMIDPGTSSQEIAAALERQGVVRSRWLFLAARALHPRARLPAGEYLFDRPMSVWQVFDHIVSGKVLQHPITIPEGLTRFEIARLVESKGFASRQEFLAECEKTERIHDLAPNAKSVEGFLFPETYQMTRPFSTAKLVDMMVERFRTVFAELAAKQADPAALPPYEVVTLASLIEKETGVGSERKLISSVFRNRLEKHMLLQCDPTVIYGLMLEQRYAGRLTRDDLASSHEYNTYLHAGLPPGPIANPGRASLEAALEPADTDYLFFVAQAGGAGGHVFSESLRAHNRAVGAYRRSR